MVTDFTAELKDVITSKLREIVSSVHSADNFDIAEELQEIQKLVIVLDSLTRIAEEIFNLSSSAWSTLECSGMNIRENAVFTG